MVWTEKESGIWVDELDGAEKIFYNLSQAFRGFGKEHSSVYAACKISVKDEGLNSRLENILRDAWKRLRFDFPSLAVVVEGPNKAYQVADPERMEQWAEETFSVNAAVSVDEILPRLHLGKLPYLIFLPSSSAVIFHASHWRIDALGACMVLNRLFDLVSQCVAGEAIPQWEFEYQNLSPSLEDAFSSPRVYSADMEALAEDIRKRNFEAAYPSAGLAFKGDSSTLPGMSRAAAIGFTTKSTSDLVAACKARGISVTAAVHAACTQAVFDHSKRDDSKYSCVVSANMREHLPLPNRNTELPPYACGTYVTGITHTLQRDDSYLARATQLTSAYRGSWDATKYMTASRLIYKVHGEALAAASAAVGSRSPPSNVTVSSLGIVDKYLRSDHGAVMVEKFQLGSAIMTRQPTLYIWTFQGRLSLSVNFNEAYYSRDSMMDLLRSITSCLERELNLSLEMS
ncbi:hypothetical protein F5Y13DRAFT_190028 [Hypoxylon sp. FL1857]|nr:hypothetical protein F5Y13DRAFT_190028 [Hypoxylon sp. FL1857]